MRAWDELKGTAECIRKDVELSMIRDLLQEVQNAKINNMNQQLFDLRDVLKEEHLQNGIKRKWVLLQKNCKWRK